MDNEKKEKKIVIEWHSVFRDLKKNIVFIVMSVLIGLMGVFIVRESVYSPEYTSFATLVVNAKLGNANPYANLSVSSEMAKVFAEVFMQPSMRSKAATELADGWFRGSLKASAIPGTNLLQVMVTTDNPEVSYHELCAVMEVYPQISDIVFENAVIDITEKYADAFAGNAEETAKLISAYELPDFSKSFREWTDEEKQAAGL